MERVVQPLNSGEIILLLQAGEIFAVTRATFAVLESLRTHQAVSL